MDFAKLLYKSLRSTRLGTRRVANSVTRVEGGSAALASKAAGKLLEEVAWYGEERRYWHMRYAMMLADVMCLSLESMDLSVLGFNMVGVERLVQRWLW